METPDFGDHRKAVFKDIATLAGSTVIVEEKGFTLEDTTIDVLSTAERVSIDRDNTTIVNSADKSKDIKAHTAQVRARVENTTSDYDREKLQKHLVKLSGGVVVLYIGAASGVEMKEKKDRIDDTLHAARATVEEDIVAGDDIAPLCARNALAKIRPVNVDGETGIEIILRALEAPLRTIVGNAGVEGPVVVSRVLESSCEAFEYDAKSG